MTLTQSEKDRFDECEKCGAGFEEEIQKLRTENARLEQLIEDREKHWLSFFKSCKHLGVMSDIRKQSKSPHYQVASGIVADLVIELAKVKAEVPCQCVFNNTFSLASPQCVVCQGTGKKYREEQDD